MKMFADNVEHFHLGLFGCINGVQRHEMNILTLKTVKAVSYEWQRVVLLHDEIIFRHAESIDGVAFEIKK